MMTVLDGDHEIVAARARVRSSVEAGVEADRGALEVAAVANELVAREESAGAHVDAERAAPRDEQRPLTVAEAATRGERALPRNLTARLQPGVRTTREGVASPAPDPYVVGLVRSTRAARSGIASQKMRSEIVICVTLGGGGAKIE